MIAIENIERRRGTITNHDNSGMLEVEVGVVVGKVEVETEPFAKFIVCVLLHPLAMSKAIPVSYCPIFGG